MKNRKLIILTSLLSFLFGCQENSEELKLNHEVNTEINSINLTKNKKERVNNKVSEKQTFTLYSQDKLIAKYDETLYVDNYLTSENGSYKLILQSDGNLVLYKTSNNQALWATNTVGSNAYKLHMQTDGNLVLYGKKYNWWGVSDFALWESKTYFNGSGIPDQKKGDYAVLQNDGNFVIYNEYGFRYALWATGTNQ